MKKQRISFIIFIIGLVALIAAGIVFLIKLLSVPAMPDAKYLVEAGTWTEQNTTDVVWKFTEIGKGTLTTNNHVNDYDFIWALDGDRLKIETAWLYNLENEYKYELDQSAGTLTLTSPDNSEVIIFEKSAASSSDTSNPDAN